jgi:hypothetical protein
MNRLGSTKSVLTQSMIHSHVAMAGIPTAAAMLMDIPTSTAQQVTLLSCYQKIIAQTEHPVDQWRSIPEYALQQSATLAVLFSSILS